MKGQMDSGDRTVQLLRKMLIVQMALAGIGQPQIRKVVGGGMGEINALAKLVRPKKQTKD